MPESTRADSTLRWLDRLLIVEIIGLTFLLACFLDADTDIWWHLKAGRAILTGGGIPLVDSYLFSVAGAEWIDLQWGFQIAAAWLYNHWGFAALTLMTAAAASLAIAIALAATARGRRTAAILWCWLPAVLVMSDRFFPRPEIFSLVCLAAGLLVLHTADAKPQRLWLLVPIQLIWVNVQGLFVLGLIVIACWVIDRAWSGAMSRTQIDWRHRWGAPAAAALVCLANPYTWKGALFPLTLFRRMSTERGFYGQHIGELMSIPELVRRTGISSVYVRISLLLLVAAAASFFLRRVRFHLLYFRILIFVAFAGLGLLAARNQPQFALVAGAVLAWNVGDWLAVRPNPTKVDRAIYALLTSATLVGLMLWVATGRFYIYAAEGRRIGLGEQPAWYAHDAATFASREGLPSRFLAFHEGQAAVLEFHMRPDQRVFVDPRLEVTPRPALERYYELAAAMAARKGDWADLIPGASEPPGFLIDHTSHHALEGTLLADGRWRCVWFDAVAGVYVPSTATHVIEEHGLDFAARYFAAGERQPATGLSMALADSFFKVGRDLLAAGDPGRRLGRILMLLAMPDVADDPSQMSGSSHLLQVIAGASLHAYGYPDGETSPGQWRPEVLLGVARATFFLGRALQYSPTDFQSWLALFGIAQSLRDPEALWTIGGRLVGLRPTSALEFEVQRQARGVLRQVMFARASEPPVPVPIDTAELTQTVNDLVGRHRFTAALDLLERSANGAAGIGPLPSELSDLRARLLLLAGDPERARAAWSAATDASPQTRANVASTYLVERRLSAAADAYRAALAADPSQTLARFGLAGALLELRDASGFVRECQTAIDSHALPRGPAQFCEEMIAVAKPFGSETGQRRATGSIGRDKR